MIITVPRWMIVIVGISYGLYHAVLGVASMHLYTDAQVPTLAIMLFSVALVSTIAVYPDIKLPMIHALLVLAVSIAVPLLTNPYIKAHVFNSYATWYIGGLGVLLTATIVRRQYVIAWIAGAAVFAEVLLWAQDLNVITEGGLLGGFLVLLVAGQAVSSGVEVAARHAQRLADQAASENAAAIATTVRRAERQVRTQKALTASRPILNRIVDSNGQLSDAEKAEATLAEVELRDEIRGRSLVVEPVRTAARLARQRGVEVTFLDEGGLDQCDDEDQARVLREVAHTLDGIQAGKVTVRAPKGEKWKVTMVAVEPGANAPAIWLKLG